MDIFISCIVTPTYYIGHYNLKSSRNCLLGIDLILHTNFCKMFLLGILQLPIITYISFQKCFRSSKIYQYVQFFTYLSKVHTCMCYCLMHRIQCSSTQAILVQHQIVSICLHLQEVCALYFSITSVFLIFSNYEKNIGWYEFFFYFCDGKKLDQAASKL